MQFAQLIFYFTLMVFLLRLNFVEKNHFLKMVGTKNPGLPLILTNFDLLREIWGLQSNIIWAKIYICLGQFLADFSPVMCFLTLFTVFVDYFKYVPPKLKHLNPSKTFLFWAKTDSKLTQTFWKLWNEVEWG